MRHVALRIIVRLRASTFLGNPNTICPDLGSGQEKLLRQTSGLCDFGGEATSWPPNHGAERGGETWEMEIFLGAASGRCGREGGTCAKENSTRWCADRWNLAGRR